MSPLLNAFGDLGVAGRSHPEDERETVGRMRYADPFRAAGREETTDHDFLLTCSCGAEQRIDSQAGEINRHRPQRLRGIDDQQGAVGLGQLRELLELVAKAGRVLDVADADCCGSLVDGLSEPIERELGRVPGR